MTLLAADGNNLQTEKILYFFLSPPQIPQEFLKVAVQATSKQWDS